MLKLEELDYQDYEEMRKASALNQEKKDSDDGTSICHVLAKCFYSCLFSV